MASSLPLPALIVVSIIIGIMNLTIILGNTLVVIAFIRNHQLRVTRNFYIFNLALTDLFIGAFSVPFYSPTLWFGVWPFGTGFCVVWTIFDVTASTTATYALLLISYDRYKLVKDPLKYKTEQTPSVAVLRIVICWLVAFLVRAPFVVFGELWFSNSKKGASCEPQHRVEVPFVIGLPLYDIIYTSISTVGEWALPLILIVHWNYKVYSKIRLRTRRNTISHLIANTFTGVRLAANVVTAAALQTETSVDAKPKRKLAFVKKSGRVGPISESPHFVRFSKQKSVSTISSFSRTSESRRVSLNELSKELQSYNDEEDAPTNVSKDKPTYVKAQSLTVEKKNSKGKMDKRHKDETINTNEPSKHDDKQQYTGQKNDRHDSDKITFEKTISNSKQVKRPFEIKARNNNLNGQKRGECTMNHNQSVQSRRMINSNLPDVEMPEKDNDQILVKESLTIIYTNLTVTSSTSSNNAGNSHIREYIQETKTLQKKEVGNLSKSISHEKKHTNACDSNQNDQILKVSDLEKSDNLPDYEVDKPPEADGTKNLTTNGNETAETNASEENQKLDQASNSPPVLQYHHRTVHKRKAVLTISLIIGMFVVFKTPYQMTLLIMATCPKLGECVPREAYESVLWLYWTKSVFNPFLYAFISKTFRQYCLQIFHSIGKKFSEICIRCRYCKKHNDFF